MSSFNLFSKFFFKIIAKEYADTKDAEMNFNLTYIQIIANFELERSDIMRFCYISKIRKTKKNIFPFKPQNKPTRAALVVLYLVVVVFFL